MGRLQHNLLVLYLWPIHSKIEVRIIWFAVALDTTRGRGHKPVTFAWITGVLPTGTVTLLTLDIRKLRRGV